MEPEKKFFITNFWKKTEQALDEVQKTLIVVL